MGLRIKLGPFELELSEDTAGGVFFITFCTMIAAAVITGLVII